MQTRIEAPVQEPRSVSDDVRGGEVHLAEVSRAFARRGGGSLGALAGVSLDVAAGQTVAVVGPSGCGKTTLLELVCGLQAPDAGTVVAGPAVLMPQRDLLLPWLQRDRQRRAGRCAWRVRRARRRASARTRCSPRSASRASSAHAPTSCRAACASASRSCARCWPASPCCAWTSRSARSTR